MNVSELDITEFFEIGFDIQKNRLDVKLKGFWKDEELYAKMNKAFEKNLSKASPGWKMLIDLTEFLTPPAKFGQEIERMQKFLADRGLTKIGEVLPKSVVATQAINRISNGTGLQRNQFSSVDEALNWLEQ